MKRLLIFYLATLANLTIATSQEFKELNLDDLFGSQRLKTAPFQQIHSLNDGVTYAKMSHDSLNTYSYKSGKLLKTLIRPEDIIPDGDSSPIDIQDFTFSPDEKKILLSTQTEMIYRRSSKSLNFIYDLENSTLFPLPGNEKQRLVSFSPDSDKLAYVKNNNLFVLDIAKKNEIQITTDGKPNAIINGASDWVYEEEFGFTKAYQWSPDGKRIAFYKFDELHVREFSLTIWGDLYPEEFYFKYPKSGEKNSLVAIHIYDLDSGSTIKVDTGDETDIYIPRIKWTSDPEELAIQCLNRRQNEMKILLANASEGATSTIYSESNKYYIEINDDLTFLQDGNGFLLTSEQDGYNHIYLFDMLGNLEQKITEGPWDVDKLMGMDEKTGQVYYVSAESSPLNRELYSIQLDGTGKNCLSENLGTNSVSFSTKFNYHVNTFSTANTPPVTTIRNNKGKKIRTLEDNHKLEESLSKFNLPETEFFNFTTKDGVTLNAWMIKPTDFHPDKKYPVMMYVYGGPGSQTVRNSWGRRNLWFKMLAQKGIIVVSVDNRGTGSRGEEFKKMTYLHLGKYETIDQIEAARYLGSLPYVDPQRIGIWGWSYGGFMSLSCLMKGPDEFCMGIAVAPVTNWRYYDNIYTERYMRTPNENPEGYNENSPINHVDKLKGNLLLIHGTADDNVHLQNSMDLISALVKADKQFEMQFYPNSNHGIYTGANTTLHLYTLLTDFILDHLLKKAE